MVKSNKNIMLGLVVVALVGLSLVFNAGAQPVNVRGHAFIFGLLGEMLEGATYAVLERPDLGQMTTGAGGAFGFGAQVGDNVTIVMSKDEYRTTQTSTMRVLPGPTYAGTTELTVQIPSTVMWEFMKLIVEKESGVSMDSSACQVVVTVCAANKTMENVPQGEPNTTVAIHPPMPAGSAPPFYFGAFKEGLLKNLTDPFAKGLTSTSFDGGVVFLNVPASDEPYVITAYKEGIVDFSYTVIQCTAGSFVNGSPPWGPEVGGPLQ